MGRDKALLVLGGRTLVERAVSKLRAVAGEVYVLGGSWGADSELSRYGPVVGDLHPGCGPMAGLEAALTHSKTDWNVLMAVDMPFFPEAEMRGWIDATVTQEQARISMFRIAGMAQPTLLLVHRELRAYVEAAVARGRYKMTPVLREAAEAMARRSGVAADRVLIEVNLDREDAGERMLWWFSNVNTEADFAQARAFVEEHGIEECI
jgi:molybdopterin-guanine dinucleotide biosynthesis protein A